MNEPTRILDVERPLNRLERRAAQLLGADAELPELSPAAQARVAQRLRERVRQRSVPSLLAWRRGIAVAVFALSSFAVAAVVRWHPHLPTWLAPAPSPLPEPPRTRVVPRQAPVSLPEEAPPEPQVMPAAVQRAVADARRTAARPVSVAQASEPRRATAESTPPVPDDVHPVDPFLREANLLAQALRKLHGRDAAGTLAALDTYDAEFPGGRLVHEALLARVDAWMMLGRKAEVLGLLEKRPRGALAALPRGEELLVLEAELWAERGRCADALPAFERALAIPGALRGRALIGRASCRAEAADAAGARADLEAYLSESPEGPFAAQAKAALGR